MDRGAVGSCALAGTKTHTVPSVTAQASKWGSPRIRRCRYAPLANNCSSAHRWGSRALHPLCTWGCRRSRSTVLVGSRRWAWNRHRRRTLPGPMLQTRREVVSWAFFYATSVPIIRDAISRLFVRLRPLPLGRARWAPLGAHVKARPCSNESPSKNRGTWVRERSSSRGNPDR